MSLHSLHWESQLLNLAQEALESHKPEPRSSNANRLVLEAAYRRCEEITREYSRTFFLASGLLPGQKRRAIRALYAFCRVSDDLVDRPNGDASSSLAAWRKQTLTSSPISDDLVALAWIDTCLTYQIPWRYAEQLIDGVARDLHSKPYHTFGELATYCYGVACTVGLMSMHIVGYYGDEALPYAIRLGVALQLTNILRDVGEDWRAGRLYLPLEELEDFGLSEADIEAGVVHERWREFMRFQIARNRRLYAEALPGIQMLAPEGRFAIAAAAEMYSAILDDIEDHDYDVFNRRASVSTAGKLRRLPGIWYRAKSGGY